MTDLFELFDVEVEETEVKTVKASQKAKAAVKEKQKTAAEKKVAPVNENEELELNAETIIRFASLNHSILDYFTEEEINAGLPTIVDEKEELKKITKEDIRVRMERDYPELVKELTHVYFVKEKNLLVVMNSAGKKGSMSVEKTTPNGVVFLKNHKMFFSKTNKAVKIPLSILNEFISIARGFALYKLEVHGDIYFNPSDNQYVLNIPNQNTSTYLVTPFEPTLEEALTFSQMVKVMEIHSHHVLPPYPSSIDNESETGNVYYAIVGNLYNFFPDITVRVYDFEKQKHIELNPFNVFETNIQMPDNYPQVIRSEYHARSCN